jgi:Rps23 Pro-64 3,4-dihydroxylase Tpa1-like proline 4-hydroxylase
MARTPSWMSFHQCCTVDHLVVTLAACLCRHLDQPHTTSQNTSPYGRVAALGYSNAPPAPSGIVVCIEMSKVGWHKVGPLLDCPRQTTPCKFSPVKSGRQPRGVIVVYLHEMNVKDGFIPSDIDRDKGSELHGTFQSGEPYPHIVIDDFLPPSVLENCLKRFPAGADQAEEKFDRNQERLKESFNPDTLHPTVRELFYSFNSRPFIRIVENVTGIKGLIPDPYFAGGGFHRVSQGGHLSIHADFNHHKPMNLERRVNVLIYLNKDWRPEYGGSFELWEPAMTKCTHAIVPIFNRCVMFNTTLESMHGNPQPINHPDRVPRRSIALYYYTSTWDDSKRETTTQFRVRPGSADRVDWRIKISDAAKELTPPLVARQYRRLKKRFAGA